MLELLTQLILSNPLTLIFGVTTVVFLILFIREQERRSQALKNNEKLITQIEDQSSQVLQDAIEKSRSILEQVAVEQVRTIEATKEQSARVEKLYANFLSNLQKNTEGIQEETQKTLKQQAISGIEKIEQNLADFLNATQQQSIGSIQLEIQASRQLVETYKRRQLALIDENVVAILERTVGLVLSKRLTIKDHLDLVYEALEKAKTEKFVV